MSGEAVSFGRFRFDLGRRELSRDEVPVRLGSRALDVLFVLAAAKGDVVTKDELLARVWPGQIVEENNLQVQVSALRKALDEDKSGQSYLVTVPGRGYRLIGRVGGAHGPALPDKPSIAVLPFQNMSDDPRQRIASPGMLLKKFPPIIGSAPPNRLGGAHGGNYQHGRAARGSVGGGGALLVGRAGREGMHP